MQSYLQIICQLFGQLLTITYTSLSWLLAVFPNINTNLFIVVDRIGIVLYSKCSVTYLKNCGKCG